MTANLPRVHCAILSGLLLGSTASVADAQGLRIPASVACPAPEALTQAQAELRAAAERRARLENASRIFSEGVGFQQEVAAQGRWDANLATTFAALEVAKGGLDMYMAVAPPWQKKSYDALNELVVAVVTPSPARHVSAAGKTLDAQRSQEGLAARRTKTEAPVGASGAAAVGKAISAGTEAQDVLDQVQQGNVTGAARAAAGATASATKATTEALKATGQLGPRRIAKQLDSVGDLLDSVKHVFTATETTDPSNQLEANADVLRAGGALARTMQQTKAADVLDGLATSVQGVGRVQSSRQVSGDITARGTATVANFTTRAAQKQTEAEAWRVEEGRLRERVAQLQQQANACGQPAQPTQPTQIPMRAQVGPAGSYTAEYQAYLRRYEEWQSQATRRSSGSGFWKGLGTGLGQAALVGMEAYGQYQTAKASRASAAYLIPGDRGYGEATEAHRSVVDAPRPKSVCAPQTHDRCGLCYVGNGLPC